MRLLLHRQAREAKVWVEVEVEDKAHEPRFQGPKGVSMPLNHRLILLINGLYRVCFCYLAYWLSVCLFLYRLKTPQIHIVTKVLHFSCTYATLDKFALLNKSFLIV